MADRTRRCWAASLSACRGKLSAEHVFSRGLSPSKKVIGSGLPHLGSGRLVSIDDFRVRNLCRGHNSDLSDLDQAAVDLLNVARETNEIARERLSKPTDRVPARVAYRLDGLRVERWTLKTTLNTSQARAKDWRWQPPANFAAIVFGKEPPPKGCGLGFLDNVSDPSGAYNGVGCNYYRMLDTGDVTASIIGFGGFLFLCTWCRPVAELVPLRAKNFRAEAVALRREAVELPGTNVWIEFDWTGSYQNDVDHRIAALRSKYARPARR